MGISYLRIVLTNKLIASKPITMIISNPEELGVSYGRIGGIESENLRVAQGS